MRNFSKMAGMAALLAALTMTGSCGGGGGGDAPVVANPSVAASIAATVNPDGTATTGPVETVVAAPAGTPGYLEAVRVTMSPNTVITARNADGTPKPLTGPLSFTFSAPADSSAAASGTSGVPVPSGMTALAATSGAVEVRLTGAASATFNPEITLTMPVPGKAVGSLIKVYTVTGTTYTLVGTVSCRPTGFVSFPVSSLGWQVGDPNPDPGVAPTTAVTTVQATTTTIPGTTTVSPTTVPLTTTVPVTTTVPGTTTVLPTTIATTTTTAPPTLDGVALYAANCAICHGPLLTPATGRKIPNTTTPAIIRSFNMDRGLTDAQLLAIIAVLPP